MIKVSKMIEVLSKLPPDANCYAYEGEVTGLIVVDDERNPLAEIYASELDREEREPEIYA